MKSEIRNPKLEVRAAVVAGRFYPSNPGELREMVGGFLRGAAPAAEPGAKAIIAPHAGYVFSGPIAGSAYAQLAPFRRDIRRVVLLGPSHYVSFSGLAVTSASGFATPLGIVPQNKDGLETIANLPQVRVFNEAHAREHSLEVLNPRRREAALNPKVFRGASRR